MRITAATLTSALALGGCLLAAGCGPVEVDFATIEKPQPAPELAPLDCFVGDWTLEAERTLKEGNVEKWTGTASWKWVLSDMYLHGDLTVSGPTSFVASGYWGWHPIKKIYVWRMINDWGYPQEGTATYDDETKKWVMNYKGIGLDGTDSWGRYILTWLDDNTIEWAYHEWADGLKMIKKVEMQGAYKRKQ